MNKQARSDFLFPQNSFLIGMGSALNLGGNYFYYNTSRTTHGADARALSSDWEVVGKLIMDSIHQFKANNHLEHIR